MFTYVYSCLPMLACVYLCWHMFTYVYHLFTRCLPQFVRAWLLMFTHVYSFLLTLNRALNVSVPMFTRVYLCLHQFTCVYPCNPCLCIFTLVYLVLLVFTYVYYCYSRMFTYAYPCLLELTYVYLCLLVFIYIYFCLPMFTPVYLCLPLVYSCLPTFTTLCLPMFTHVYPCLLMFTYI